MIRFPKMHIAESVANRLLNFASGLDSGGVARPSIPEPNPAGAELDARLTAPTEGAAPDAGVVAGVVTGESPIDTLVRD